MIDLTLVERKVLVELLVDQYTYELKKRATAKTLDPDFTYGEETLLKLIDKLSIESSECALLGV